MAVVGTGEAAERALTQVKGVDDLYPLIGTVVLEAAPLAEALAAVQGGLPGAVMDKVLVDRLGLAVGDTFRLGVQEFRLGAVLLREPDCANGGFSLGPRTIVRTADLAGIGAAGTGVAVRNGISAGPAAGARTLPRWRREAEAAFRDSGMGWSDSRRAAPGVERFRGPDRVVPGAGGACRAGRGRRGRIRPPCAPIWKARLPPSPR
jgi:putative ABC transport system permease protein